MNMIRGGHAAALLRAALALVTALVTSATALADKITYYHNDLLGSPVAATNETGQVIWHERYGPYGDRQLLETASARDNIWFTSRHEDGNTELVYMGARYYDPMVGRFMAVDSQGFDSANVHSFNRYVYANNNPYRYVDPNGNVSLPFVAAVSGVLVIAGGVYLSDAERRASMARDLRRLGENFQSNLSWAGDKLQSLIFSDQPAEGKDSPAERPKGVPENWKEEPTRGEGGRQWVNPENSGDRVRVMPGDPNSPNPSQRRPYVRDVRSGNQWLDVDGNRIEGQEGKNSPNTHIPVEDYVFRP